MSKANDRMLKGPNMSDAIGKPAWHAYHNKLFVFLKEPFEDRIRRIKTTKPKAEIGLRFLLFKLIHGEMPKEVVDANRAVDAAERTFDIAMAATHKPCSAYHVELRRLVDMTTSPEDREAAYKHYDKNRTELAKAYDVSVAEMHSAGDAIKDMQQAYEDATILHASEIEALHDLECPDCPWDGSTIFPNGVAT